MADAHWAASARMPSNLLLAEAVTAAQEAGWHGNQPDALQWVVVLQHLTHCCQAYRQVLIFSVPSSSSSFSPLPLLLFLPTIIPALLILLLLLSPLCILPCHSSSCFFAPVTFTFSNSTICRRLQTSNSPLLTSPPLRQHHKKNNSPQPIPLSMCLQGRTGARAFCRVGPPEERPDQPAEQATSQQQNMGIHHSGSAAAAVRGCLVPGAVQRRYACCARSHDQLQTQLPHAPTHR